jgi:hypothetical protein
MRAIALVFTFHLASGVFASAVASDLALLARSPADHPVARIPGIKSADIVAPNIVATKSLIIRKDSRRLPQINPVEIHEEEPLSQWRVRVALAVVVIVMVAALCSVTYHTAKVFGLISDKQEAPLSPKVDNDPESLTRLLNMQSIRGYSAIFSGRGLIGRPVTGEDKPTLIIQ